MSDETLNDEAPTPEIGPGIAPEAPLPPPAPWRRRRRRGEVAIRYLLDSRLFGLLCAPGGEAALEGFRASLERHGLASEDGLPSLELSPVTFLEVLGIDPPQLPICPLPASLLKSSENVMAAMVLVKYAEEELQKRPEIAPDLLRKRVEELRPEVPAEAHGLFDLCLTRFVGRDGFAQEIYRALGFDYVYRFPFPEVLREGVFDFFCSSLFDASMSIPGSSKIRVIKALWDKSYERLLRGNVGARGEIQALDRELRLRSRRDHLAWESVHYATLGYPGKERGQAVTAFTLDSEERAATRCIAYKTTLRAFLDQLTLEDLASIRPAFDDWKPGSLVPCREDGSFETVLATGDLPVYLALRKAS